MKLSVSAYRAQASAHKKILSNYQHQLSYGATNQASSTRTPSDPATFLTGFKVRESFVISTVPRISNYVGNPFNDEKFSNTRFFS